MSRFAKPEQKPNHAQTEKRVVAPDSYRVDAQKKPD